MAGIPNRHAAVIGIDAYHHGVASLRSAVADARAVAHALRSEHGYSTDDVLLDAAASRTEILRVLAELPQRLGPDSTLVLYFAGHGIAQGDGSKGPEGFLLPYDANASDETTWLAMATLKEALWRLPCRHLLVILDCCFAGCFRWASTRNFVPVGRPLYDSQLQRYLLGTAWQVLTSASHEETALDTAPMARNSRDTARSQRHSPFAAALLQGLAGEADSSRGGHQPDGVVTATELYQYIFEELVPPGGGSHQTPGLWPLKPESTGEFVFRNPRQERRTRPDPPLDDGHNPWPGLSAYTQGEADLFFGRKRVVRELLDRLLDPSLPPLLAVVGASGTGKSSVVQAGLLPCLSDPPESLAETVGRWNVVQVERLHGDPRVLLDKAERQLEVMSQETPPGTRRLLFVDQFEELYTRCPEAEAREQFLQRLRRLLTGKEPVRLVLTLRSDFEPYVRFSKALADLQTGRYLVPAPTLEELRATVEGPARARALYFDPKELVDELVEEVTSLPGALPLLSFALAEMYRHAAIRRRRTGTPDRALTRQDYEGVGGVVGALHHRANALLKEAEANGRLATIRRLALRMVSVEGGRVTRRRISLDELKYAEKAENERVAIVLEKLIASRLVVQDGEYVEPAHDTLVQAWPSLTAWLTEAAATKPLQSAVWAAASAWEDGGRADGYLWDQDPRLEQALGLFAELNRLEQEFLRASRRRKAVEAGRTAALAVSNDGRILAIAGLDRIVRRWDVTAGSVLDEVRLDGDGRFSCLAWSADGARLASGNRDGDIGIWDPATGQSIISWRHRHKGPVISLVWSGDSRVLASAGKDGTLRLWDVASGAPCGELLVGGENRPDRAFSIDEETQKPNS